MKTIATFWKPEEAHLLRLRLDAAGIESFLQDEAITQMHPWRAAAIGGVRVQVADSEVAAVEKILALEPSPPLQEPSPHKNGDLECLSCHASIPLGQTRCSSCGWSYEDTGVGLKKDNP